MWLTRCSICNEEYGEGGMALHTCRRELINQSRPMIRGTYNTEWANDIIREANYRSNELEGALRKIMNYIEGGGTWLTVIYDIAEEAIKRDKE
jgi:hypothetical protein